MSEQTVLLLSLTLAATHVAAVLAGGGLAAWLRYCWDTKRPPVPMPRRQIHVVQPKGEGNEENGMPTVRIPDLSRKRASCNAS